MNSTMMLAVLLAAAALAILLLWLRAGRGAVKAPTEQRLTALCSDTTAVTIPAGRVRAVFRVVRDCGAGVSLEKKQDNATWNGILPNRAGPPPEDERGFQGTAVFYGTMPGEHRLRCLPGTGEVCEVMLTVTEVGEGSNARILNESVTAPCGRTAFIARFNGLRRDRYEARLIVESDCGSGVRVERFNHQNFGVRVDDGPETVPAVNREQFEVGAGHRARWNVQSAHDNGNVWFHVTCLAGTSGSECKFRVEVTDPTV